MFVHLIPGIFPLIYRKTRKDVITLRIKSYQEIFTQELHREYPFLLDEVWRGKGWQGFYGAVDLNNEPVSGANKTSVLNARILWTFAAAANKYPGKGYEPIAHIKHTGCVTEDFADKEHGGFYMELSADNEVANDIKHTYAQAFVIYSLSKYYEFNPVSRGDWRRFRISSIFSTQKPRIPGTPRLL